MKKHAIWLIVLALLLTSAVALAANEPLNQHGTISTVGKLTPQQGTGGGCTIGNWTTVDNLTTARSRPSAAYSSATGRFYVLGGEASGGNRNIPIEEYDAGSDLWTDRANLLTGVSNLGSVGVGNYIYVPGGWNGAAGISDMQRYDPVANVVTTMAALPGGVAANGVAAVGTDIYVMGGSSTGAAGTTNYIYDTVGDSWSTGAPLLTAVNYPAVASDGTYVYVLGGNTTNLTTVQRYDPVGNSWTALTSMSTGRGGPGAFFDGQNIWAIAGGWSTYLTSTEYWDGVSWNPGPSVNTGVRTVGAAFNNGVGMKAGGWNGAYSDVAETIAIDCSGASIAISKDPAIQDVYINGDANFTITVTNTGGVQLDNVTVTDALVPDCDASLGSLAPGASNSYACTDIGVPASYVNVADVTSTIGTAPGPSGSASAQVNVIDGGIEISKAPDYQEVDTGGTANFTITVTNTGQVSLGNVTVVDALAPGCDSVIGPLGVGETNTYTCSLIGVGASFTNTAVVTGAVDANLPPLMDTDDAWVEVTNPTSVSLSGLGGESAAISPIWLVALLGLILGFGVLMRRRLTD